MWDTRAAACAAALQRWYRPRRGLWSSAGWWNGANALTALIDHVSVTGDSSYAPVIATTFRHAPGWRHRGFVNDFYDDCGWWGLAWVDAHTLTGSAEYLSAAESIFRYLTRGWDDGMWWTTRRDYKNAITNELFGQLAARLHAQTERPSYLDWARREWDWFMASGMINSSGLINDGLTRSGANNGGTTWTYNQGVILGFAAAMHAATGSAEFLSVGSSIASAAMSSLTSPEGVLTEPGSPSGDTVQFKGIFLRNLRAFAAAADLPGYRDFVLTNAASSWSLARNPADQFGYRWQGPFDKADAARQSAALDLLNAAAALP
jgi:predicted alpha-1,6-mannanase (GH76 family)